MKIPCSILEGEKGPAKNSKIDRVNKIRLSSGARKRFDYLKKPRLVSEGRSQRLSENLKGAGGKPKKRVKGTERGRSIPMPTNPSSSQVIGGVGIGILPKKFRPP
ncbi:hypothetical protein JTB14_004288 [Gonioctena quinquepunctata]|nr:hypothetical protein JTB14_004288 [Gonioctena quinquepunctata]